MAHVGTEGIRRSACRAVSQQVHVNVHLMQELQGRCDSSSKERTLLQFTIEPTVAANKASAGPLLIVR